MLQRRFRLFLAQCINWGRNNPSTGLAGKISNRCCIVYRNRISNRNCIGIGWLSTPTISWICADSQWLSIMISVIGVLRLQPLWTRSTFQICEKICINQKKIFFWWQSCARIVGTVFCQFIYEWLRRVLTNVKDTLIVYTLQGKFHKIC